MPPEVDLSGLTFMPLDVQRLRDSELVSDASPQEFRAAVLLWCAAWHQVPAASLPDKDSTLARLAGFGQSPSELRAGRKVREGALRGFVLCRDGRLYHPVVAEKALDAWSERREVQGMREAESVRKRRERAWRSAATDVLRNHGIVLEYNVTTGELRKRMESLGYVIVVDESFSASVTGPRDSHGRATAKKRSEVEGSEEEWSGEERREAVNTKAARAAEGDNSPAAQLAAVLAAAHGRPVAADDPEVQRAVTEGISKAELEAACAGVVGGKPPRYYVQRAIGRRLDAKGSTPAAPAATRPRDPDAEARAERRRAIEDQIIDVRHCADRGIGDWTPERAAARIAELQTELASLAEEVVS